MKNRCTFRLMPMSTPNSNPNTKAKAYPLRMRLTLMATSPTKVPLGPASSATMVLPTDEMDGMISEETSCAAETVCHATSMPTGRINANSAVSILRRFSNAPRYEAESSDASESFRADGSDSVSSRCAIAFSSWRSNASILRITRRRPSTMRREANT